MPIRRYPLLKDEFADLHTQSMTADYSGDPHGSGAARGTELIAIRELPTNKQREYEAVRKAIEITEQYPNGKQRLAVIRLVLWDRQYTLEGAAMKIPCSESHAKEWHGDFIRLVASNYGMLD